MPPRKKPRVGASTTSTPARDVQTPAAATPAEQDTPNQPPISTTEMVLDPWTDEQETALFKGVIRWKPAGRFDFSLTVYRTFADEIHPQGCTNTSA